MRVAVISDIHAHLGRLNAVLDYLNSQDIDQILCLGDIVGYGRQPNECVEIIRNLHCPTLMGNHDYVAVGRGDVNTFSPKAKTAIVWTQEQLTKENKKFLESLPFTYKNKTFLAVHASPQNPENWEYVLTKEVAMTTFAHFKEQICFIGHSHIPFFLELNPQGKGHLMHDNPLEIKNEHRYLINVGSVGQPRDKDPKSAFIIYDDTQKTVSLKRITFQDTDDTDIISVD